MELYIKEIRWSVNRVTGERRERVTFEGTVPCTVGDIEVLASERKSFSIDRVTENNVTLTVHYLTNPDADKTLLVQKGEMEFYAPRSFGAGYVYEFKLV